LWVNNNSATMGAMRRTASKSAIDHKRMRNLLRNKGGWGQIGRALLRQARQTKAAVHKLRVKQVP
jgi:hypothetical protein